MKVTDITIDFETCALTPTAAVMAIGAVAWNRDGEETPFFEEDDEIGPESVYIRHIDLRSEFTEGFTFDQRTAEWWQRQSKEAKAMVNAIDADDTCVGIEVALKELAHYISDIMVMTGAGSVRLWSQGSDFDLAILRHICHKFGYVLPVEYRDFRDHRTFNMETAAAFYDTFKGERPRSEEDLRGFVNEGEEDRGIPHEPISDCKRSILATWRMMRRMREVKSAIKWTLS